MRALREHVAVVSQRGDLFDGTVWENVVFGGEKGNIGDVRAAGRAAGVDLFVEGMGGYGVDVGERGAKLSLGQGQRVCVARALVRRAARVLVLDECTSALDGESERVVVESVIRGRMWDGEGAGGRKKMPTRVVVTHKLRVMRACERVVVVDGGRVVEEGRYDELMRRKGVFWSLANAGEWQGDSE